MAAVAAPHVDQDVVVLRTRTCVGATRAQAAGRQVTNLKNKTAQVVSVKHYYQLHKECAAVQRRTAFTTVPLQRDRELPGRDDRVRLHPSSAPECLQSLRENPGKNLSQVLTAYRHKVLQYCSGHSFVKKKVKKVDFVLMLNCKLSVCSYSTTEEEETDVSLKS